MVRKRIPKKINNAVKNYARRLLEKDKLPIEKVIIFGSYGKGTQIEGSDVDVCIVSPKFKDSVSALSYLWQSRSDEETRLGLEPFGISPKDFKKGSSLIREIVQHGVEVPL